MKIRCLSVVPALLTAALLLSGCKVSVVPHAIDGTRVYCVYEVTAVSGAGAALQVGATVCILCPRGHRTCVDTLKITPGGGVVYDLRIIGGTNCRDCPPEGVGFQRG